MLSRIKIIFVFSIFLIAGCGSDVVIVGNPSGNLPQTQKEFTHHYLDEHPTWEGVGGEETFYSEFDVDNGIVYVYVGDSDDAIALRFVINDDGSFETEDHPDSDMKIVGVLKDRASDNPIEIRVTDYSIGTI